MLSTYIQCMNQIPDKFVGIFLSLPQSCSFLLFQLVLWWWLTELPNGATNVYSHGLLHRKWFSSNSCVTAFYKIKKIYFSRLCIRYYNAARYYQWYNYKEVTMNVSDDLWWGVYYLHSHNVNLNRFFVVSQIQFILARCSSAHLRQTRSCRGSFLALSAHPTSQPMR